MITSDRELLSLYTMYTRTNSALKNEENSSTMATVLFTT